tara:strand:+ start:259 stop:786 length:528 start_codon:yes stop_codon:yes gene_type:complete
MKPILKGKGFILRHITLADAQKYFECVGDKKLKQALLRIPKNLAEVKKDLRGKIADFKKKKPFGEAFVIEVDGEFAGEISIHHLNIEHHEHKGELGYSVLPKFRRKGLAAKAVKLLTNYAFKKYKLKRISAWGRAKNKASAKTLEKAGYKLEGILRKNKCVDGVYLDDFVYARVR